MIVIEAVPLVGAVGPLQCIEVRGGVRDEGFVRHGFDGLYRRGPGFGTLGFGRLNQ